MKQFLNVNDNSPITSTVWRSLVVSEFVFNNDWHNSIFIKLKCINSTYVSPETTIHIVVSGIT